ncbi:MAG: hypothetical protein V4685_07295 [Bacteroidota bacterium]
MERSVDILNELNEISPVVAGIGSANVFVVPEGYFEAVPATVLACINNEISAGADVPAGYFDTLSNNILSKIDGTVAHELQEISPFMASLEKLTPYEVPANYFEQVAGNTTSLVAEDNVPAVLQGVNKVQPFEVPAGYFEQLAGNVLKKVKEQGGAKIIAMPKRSNTFLKYAVAAVFTGVAALGVYKYVDTTTTHFETPVAMDEKKFNEKLDNVNEEDIIKYLEKNGSEEDLAALSSGIDEKDLPDQEEYFTDETTLDKFLEDIDLKN